MKHLLPHLALRLENIFSPEEITSLKNTFSLPRRPVSFSCNTLTSSPQEIEDALKKADISFTRLDVPNTCYLLDSKYVESDLWNLDIYTDGKIYLQTLASQLPVHYFSDKSPKYILDACAAPGGKTFQLVKKYPDAQIYSFEPNTIRFQKMQHNLKKLGIESHVTALKDSIQNIKHHIPETDFFDMILIDAPCSSEGSLLYNKEKFLKNWDISHIERNSNRQRSIIASIIPYLAPSGELIYATCTIAPEENEAIASYILSDFPQIQGKNIDKINNKYIRTLLPVEEFNGEMYNSQLSEYAFRVFPNAYTEGFFISKFRKK